MEGKENDKQTHSRTRGALEPDCAVVPDSTVFHHHHHPYTRGVRQNFGFSEADSSVEMKDSQPTNNMTASTDFQLREHSTQNRPIRSHDLIVETKELEAEVVRLHMEDEEDEVCENGDTYVFCVLCRTELEQ